MFRTAFYEKEITPPLGCFLPGYFNLRLGSNVKDRLYARAVVIQNDTNTVALLSIDGCIMNGELKTLICNRIQKFIDIKPENVLVAYTHSHTATPRLNYQGDSGAEESQEGYFDVFSKLIADCVVLAYYRLADSEICYGMGEVTGISFCRDYIMKSSTPRTNPGRLNPDIVKPCAETDNELPVLLMKSTDGKPTGAIITFACHPDCVDGTEYSGDYISELSIQLKKLYGPDFVTVFLLGTCGDINHFDVSRAGDPADHYRKMGRKIAGEAQKVISFAEPIADDTLISKYEILKLKRKQVSDEVIANAKHIVATVKEIPGVKIAADNTSKDQYDLAMSKSLLSFLETNPEIFDVPVQFIQIGDVKIFAFPSEIFCIYGKMVKQESNAPKRFVTTMCNASFGYVPSKELLEYDTIYEARPGSNRLEADAGCIMAKKLVEMSK